MRKNIAITLLLCIMITIFTGCTQPTQKSNSQAPAPAETTIETVPAEATKTEPTAEVSSSVPTAIPASKAEIAKKVEEKAIKPEKPAEQPKTADSTKEAEPVKEEVKNDTITFTDSLGKTIIMKKNPERVVSLYTSYLDLWDMAGGKVVGRPDTKEAVPAAAKEVETIGLYTSPNLEKILALQPDLILINSDLSAQVALIPIFEKNNIPYAALKYDTFSDYAKILKIYTSLTDREDIYQTKGVEVGKKIDSIIAKVPRDRKPSVLLLLGSTKSVSVRLPNTTVGEMLKDLGTENIAYDSNLKASDMEVFSMERVIEKNPDFIFVQTMGDIDETTARVKKDIESNPAWGYLTAVKEGRYIFLPKDLFLFKPNDRYAEAYEKLAKMLYPDIFN